MRRRYLYTNVLPFAAMVAVECNNVGLSTLFKAASLKGMSYYVYVFYSYAISTIILIIAMPFVLRSSREVLPSSKFPLFSRIFLLGFIGAMSDIAGFKGIYYCSPTVDSAMSNLSPVFTFTLAVIFRMERLVLSSSSTRAKIIGTIVSVTGALVLIFYKGPTVLSASSGTQPISLHQPLGSSQSNWIIGSLLIATGYLLYSIWNIIQTQVMKMYPAEFIVVFFCYVCSTIVLAPICFIAEGNWSSWRLGADVTLVAVIYSGVFGYCLTSIIRTWGLRIKGPVFVATFKPLSIVIAASTSFIFLGDALHLGRYCTILRHSFASQNCFRQNSHSFYALPMLLEQSSYVLGFILFYGEKQKKKKWLWSLTSVPRHLHLIRRHC